jgi:hypothetical protein
VTISSSFSSTGGLDHALLGLQVLLLLTMTLTYAVSDDQQVADETGGRLSHCLPSKTTYDCCDETPSNDDRSPRGVAL